MNISIFEDIDIDLSGVSDIDEESLLHVALMPRLWFHALKMDKHEWDRAAHILSIMTSQNAHIAPQLFFLTRDVSGLLNPSGIKKLHDNNHTTPCNLENYRRLLLPYPEVAPCRPQVDLITATPAELKLNQNDIRKIRGAGFRPSVYIKNSEDIMKLQAHRGVGMILDFPQPENEKQLFFEIALLSNSHFIIWRNNENASRFMNIIQSFHVSKYYQKVFGKL